MAQALQRWTTVDLGDYGLHNKLKMNPSPLARFGRKSQRGSAYTNPVELHMLNEKWFVVQLNAPPVREAGNLSYGQEQVVLRE